MIAAAAATMTLVSGCSRTVARKGFLTQLNGPPDPSFIAQYRLLQISPGSVIKQKAGAIGSASIATLAPGDFAICDIETFLKYIASVNKDNADSEIHAIFCDLVGNPIGWILGPGRAKAIGVDVEKLNAGDREEREKIFSALRSGEIEIGDRAGTETSAILQSWLAKLGLNKIVHPVSVGSDPTVVAVDPPILFPVHINEEPYRLASIVEGPVATLVPAQDGIQIYGNIIVTPSGTSAAQVDDYRAKMRESWDWVRQHIDEATDLLGKYYKKAPDKFMKDEISKTISLAFGGENRKTGRFDTSENGLLHQSLRVISAANDDVSSLSLLEISRFFRND